MPLKSTKSGDLLKVCNTSNQRVSDTGTDCVLEPISASSHFQLELPLVLNLNQPTPTSCFPLTVLDHGTAGRTEDVILELRTLDTEVANRVTLSPSQVAILIENNDEGMFTDQCALCKMINYQLPANLKCTHSS